MAPARPARAPATTASTWPSFRPPSGAARSAGTRWCAWAWSPVWR